MVAVRVIPHAGFTLHVGPSRWMDDLVSWDVAWRLLLLYSFLISVALGDAVIERGMMGRWMHTLYGRRGMARMHLTCT